MKIFTIKENFRKIIFVEEDQWGQSKTYFEFNIENIHISKSTYMFNCGTSHKILNNNKIPCFETLLHLYENISLISYLIYIYNYLIYNIK